MKKFLLFVLLALGAFAAPAHAQQAQALVVSACGSAPAYVAGTYGILTMDTSGKLCDIATGGSVTAVSSGKANAAAPTLAEGTTNPISTDLSGNQRVIDAAVLAAVQAPLPDCGAIPCPNRAGVFGVNTWGGTALGAMADFGTSPGAVLVPGVNAFITNSPAITGTVTANQGTSPWVISGVPVTDVVCGSAVSSCQLKGSGGNFFGAYAECSAACWLMIFNATSLPSNGATTAGKAAGNMVECIAVPAGDQRSINYPVFPVAFSTGITAAISSTTCATLTAATTGFIHGTVQ